VRVDAQTATQVSTGTGFVVASNASGSYILTNDHVIGDGALASLQATLADGTKLTVLGVQRDATDDLAVLAVQEPDLPAVTWAGRSDEALGESVIALGYAAGLQGAPSVTSGILSALDRIDPSDGLSYLQHSASTNPGNSGGPLADLQGRVLGVNSYRLANAQGLFFAIPAERVLPAMRGLIAQFAAPPPTAARPPAAATPPAVSSGTGTGDPVAVVRAFYAAVTARDYGAAYALLSPRLRAALPDETTWAAQFADEHRALVTAAVARPGTGAVATVVVTLDTTWTTATGSAIERRYTGTWRLVRVQGAWLLDAPALHRSAG
jgi:S1-C subfamily serine protease